MKEHIALSYIFRLSTERAKDPALFYWLGYLFGYREELILLLLYSCFNYKPAFYFILMSKYFYLLSFLIFTIHLHQHMLTLGMDNCYFDVLRHLNLLQVLWPDHCLHAPTHLNVPSTATTSTDEQPKWTLTEITYGTFWMKGFTTQNVYINNMRAN